MNLGRLGPAALLAAVTASPAATPSAADDGPVRAAGVERHQPPGRRRTILESLREASGSASGIVQPGARQGPVFARPGDWAHAEAAVLIGSQLVDQDLGFSRNIFQTVTAEAEDVGFGKHYGARGSFFVNRYLGAEAGFARSTAEFEFLITDEEAGVVLLDAPLIQTSQEASIAAVVQWPRSAITPYAVGGYAWRTSEVEGGDPFQTGAAMIGFGIKVPFPEIPVSLAFDYRYAGYGGADRDALQLAEGGTGGPAVSSLTLGVVVRLNVNR